MSLKRMVLRDLPRFFLERKSKRSGGADAKSDPCLIEPAGDDEEWVLSIQVKSVGDPPHEHKTTLAKTGGQGQWQPPPPPYPPPPGTRGPGTPPIPSAYSPEFMAKLNLKGSTTYPSTALQTSLQASPGHFQPPTPGHYASPAHSAPVPPPSRFPQYSKPQPPESPDQKTDSHGQAALEAQIAQSILPHPPPVPWNQIQGQSNLIESLQTIIREPLEHPESGLTWSGILLYGPPGTGKTLLARAIATSAAPAKFMSVSSAELGSSWASESERLIKALFTVARKNRPIVIFIDEIDSLLGKRGSSSSGNDSTANKVKTQFLIEMEGLGRDKTGILVVAATNNPWDLDDAVLSRLRKRYYVGLPNATSRAAMLTAFLQETKIASPTLFDPQFFSETIEATKGMSGREIKALVEEAVVQAVTRRRKTNAPTAQIQPIDMVQATSSTGRSITASTLAAYKKWASDRRLSTTAIDQDLQLFQ